MDQLLETFRFLATRNSAWSTFAAKGGSRITAACLILATLLLSAGCQSRPFQVFARGCMDVVGKMKLSGDMKVSGDVNASIKTSNTASRLASVPIGPKSNSCQRRIAIVEVDGLIVNKFVGGLGAMGENPVALFREKLDHLKSDPSICAVVLRINSPGGGVTASDIMSRDLKSFKQECNIPVVACLMDVGAGGGYYLATHCDSIVAHPTSIVGGIGVILNLYNLEDTVGQFNIIPMSVKAGKKIDLASVERPMEKEEKDLLQSMADSFHDRFKEQVETTRPALADSQSLFDGRVMTGQQAFENGLVDQIGYLDDAMQLARSMAQLDASATAVMLRRDNDRAFTALDVSPNMPMQNSLFPVKLPGLDRSTLPTFLYLWQPEPSFVTASGG
jgi:protease IV